MSFPQAIEFRQTTLDQIVSLRHAVLRAGLARETAIFAGDELPNSLHFGAFIADSVGNGAVGCASFHLNALEGRPAWQLRGMAIADRYRGMGLGRALLVFADGILAARPNSPPLMWCSARAPAVRFYQLMGWDVVSDAFEIPTAGPHVKMVRELPASQG